MDERKHQHRWRPIYLKQGTGQHRPGARVVTRAMQCLVWGCREIRFAVPGKEARR